MLAFVGFCLVTVAFAEKLGYNYQDGQSGGELSLQSRNSIVVGDVDADTSFDPSPYSGLPDFEKEYFSFSAPENEFDDPSALQKIIGGMKTGLRVVFIKGPENKGLENAAIALAKQAADQKTAIYVLNKQTDIGDLVNKFNGNNKNGNNKPEVHFVKYRTPEDAANAQRAIKSQYDSLGGSAQTHDSGVAPVLNFASASPVRSAAANTPSNSYLPASILRRRYR